MINTEISCKHEGFPHSDISGSKVARHLPGAYRRHATSFIAISSQGIHHTPLNFLLGNSKTIPILFRAKAKQWDFLLFILPYETKSLRQSTSNPKRPRWDQSQSGIKLSKCTYIFKQKNRFFEAGSQQARGSLPSLSLQE